MNTKSGKIKVAKAALLILALLVQGTYCHAQFSFLTQQQKKRAHLRKQYKCEHVGIQKVSHVKNLRIVPVDRSKTATLVVSLKNPEVPTVLPTLIQKEEPVQPEVIPLKDSVETSKMKLLPLPVYFRYDSYRMDLVDLAQIAIAVNYVNDGHPVTLIGHTDNWGSEHYNHTLSIKRAGIIKDMLVQLGCKADLITVVGEGEKYPLVSNDHEHGRKNNRRVEFIVYDKLN